MFITLDGVSFSYDAPYTPVFTDINLTVDATFRCALVGANGRGKSTLLKMLSGQLQPSSGSIVRRGSANLLPQIIDDVYRTMIEVQLDIAGPYRELEKSMELYLSRGTDTDIERWVDIHESYELLHGYGIRQILRERSEKLGLTVDMADRPFCSLSGGEQQRALLAAVDAAPATWALLDEPTTHLDTESKDAVLTYLESSQRGFVLISHDESVLERLADRVISLEPDGIHVLHAPYVVWKHEREAQLLREQREQENIRRNVERLTKNATERRQWATKTEREKNSAFDSGFVGATAARMIKRALHAEQRAQRELEAAQQLLVRQEFVPHIKVPVTSPGDDIVLQVENLSIRHGKRVVVSDVSFGVRRGTIVGLSGRNGSGKSSIFNAIVNGDFEKGNVRIPRRFRTSYARQFPQWTHGSVMEHVQRAGLDEQQFRVMAASFGIPGDVLKRPLETYSYGQLKKIELIPSLLEPFDLLLWDEPWNGLDVVTAAVLRTALRESRVTMLLIDHDAQRQRDLADEIVEL